MAEKFHVYAVDALKGLGDIMLVGSSAAFNALRQNTQIKEVIKATGTPLLTLDQAKSVGSAVLAAAFGVSCVMEATGFANSIWSASYIGAVVKVNPAYDSMSVPQFGRRLVYTWTTEGVNETIVCEETVITSTRQLAYDFVVKDAFVLNATTNGAYIQIA